MVQKIAFLFLVIDNPNFPNIWNHYFKNNQNKINIYIHPKYPEKHTWKPNNIVKNIKPTAWGFIVNAYIELFKEAFENKDNIKFITLSESCVPIKPFNILYNTLIDKPNLSYIRMMNVSNYDYKIRLSENIKNNFKNKIIKHYARMCLSRQHVQLLLQNLEKVKYFADMHVGDEFFLTSIAPISNYKDMAISHDDWDYVKKQAQLIKNKIKKLYEEQEQENNTKINNIDEIKILKTEFEDICKNPKKIIKISKTDLKNMKMTESFFYRKFDTSSDIEKYIYNFI